MENNKQTEDELKSLDDIFMQGKRVFRIPDYQRGYSWVRISVNPATRFT